MPDPANTSLPITANATFCSTLVDSWIDAGITAAFIAPGSRSTPLALALTDRSELAVHLFHDERSASFAALGHGLATETPAVVLCSSGTAGTHFHAAVVEADLSAVPMLVCTADRPPELWDRGAPQTIDQTDLYGDVVRAFIEPGPPEDTDPATWRQLASIAFAAATGRRPGPVHLNLSFRDPLTGAPGPLPPPDQDAIPGRAVAGFGNTTPMEAAELAALLKGPGVIVAGRGQSLAADVVALAQRLHWPVIADHRSGCRDERAITYFDALLRARLDGQASDLACPSVILRLGEIVSSKAVSQWISHCSAEGSTIISGRPWFRLIDPEDTADHFFDEGPTLIGDVLALVDPTPDPEAVRLDQAWRDADQQAEAAVARVLATAPKANDVAIARRVVNEVPSGGALVVSSSMPVRDVEWFAGPRTDISVFSNRGANGIDGVIATAIGVALSGKPTICHIGDVAFLHDSTSLIGLAQRDLSLTIVVTDNDGGGIFSFLPQHRLLGPDRYEQLFGTPHGTDLAALCSAHGIQQTSPAEGFVPSDGARVAIINTDRGTNLDLHQEIVAAVHAAVGT